MRRIKSGFYENPVLKKNSIILKKSNKKRKNLKQSISERCLYSSKNKQLFSNNNNNFKFKEDCEVKNIDIKFNILNNLKKYNTIYNNNFYQRLVKNDKENNKSNLKFKIKLLNNNNPKISELLINKDTINENYLNDSIQNINQNINIENKENKQTQLDPHGYFPEDFSLNIYKSTSLYKNRYKIESCRLKKVLKNIYHEENSKKNKNLNNLIKKNTIENTSSIKMLRLLKSRKIDRFVNKLLDMKNIHSENKKENSKQNIKKQNNKKDNFFITNKNKEHINNIDYGDKNNNNKICIQPYSNIQNEKNNNRFSPLNNFKNNTTSSGTQTINPNNKSRIYYILRNNENKYNFLNQRYYKNNSNSDSIPYKEKNFNYKEMKFEMIKTSKKNKFLKKCEKMIRPFSATKPNSSFFDCKNNNIINNFNKDKKLIFSFYDPKDKYIQLFDELEKREIEYKYQI